MNGTMNQDGVGLLERLRARRGRVLLVVLGVAFVLWYALTGFWIVQKNEQGVVLRFGQVVRTCPAGFQVTLPWPIETLEIVRTSEVRTMCVGSRSADEVGELSGTMNEAEWLTGDTNIVEIQTVIQYTIKDPVDYLYQVADLRNGRSRDYLIRKIAESVLTSLVSRIEVDDVLSVGKAKLQGDSRGRIQELADEMRLGIQVLSVNIVEANPPPDVIAAFNDVTSAKADRVRLLSEADGFARDLLPKARAWADRILQEAEIYRSETVNAAHGATSRFLDLAAEVAESPEVSKRRLWLEAMEEALAKAKKIVYARRTGETFRLTHIE